LHPAFLQNTVAWPLAGSHALSSGPSDLDLTILLGSLQVSPRDMPDISPLPEASAELAITPTEALAPPRPSAWNRKWTAAIVVSCLLHAAVAAAFLISPSRTFDTQDAMQSEGSDQSGDKVVGSALDQDPTVMKVMLVPNPQPTKPEPAKAARPTPPTEPSQPPREATKQPVELLPEAVKQPAVTPDILVTGAPRSDDQSVAPKTETPAQPTVQAESTEAPAAVPEQHRSQAPGQVRQPNRMTSAARRTARTGWRRQPARAKSRKRQAAPRKTATAATSSESSAVSIVAFRLQCNWPLATMPL